MTGIMDQSAGFQAPRLSSNVLVAGLTSDIDEAGLRAIFADCGPIVSATVMLEVTTGRSRGFGFVCFGCHEDALRAVRSKHRSSLPGGNVLNLTLSHHSGSAQQSSSLFIRNVPAQMSARILSVLLSSFGTVSTAHISHTNDPTLFSAVVRFSTITEAAAALSTLHGAREFLLPRQELTAEEVASLEPLFASSSDAPAAESSPAGGSPHRSSNVTPTSTSPDHLVRSDDATPPTINLIRIRLPYAPLLVKYHENAAVRRGRPRPGDQVYSQPVPGQQAAVLGGGQVQPLLALPQGATHILQPHHAHAQFAPLPANTSWPSSAQPVLAAPPGFFQLSPQGSYAALPGGAQPQFIAAPQHGGGLALQPLYFTAAPPAAAGGGSHAFFVPLPGQPMAAMSAGAPGPHGMMQQPQPIFLDARGMPMMAAAPGAWGPLPPHAGPPAAAAPSLPPTQHYQAINVPGGHPSYQA